MKRVLTLAVLAAATAAVGVSPVRAAPIRGATHVSGTWSDPSYLFTYAAGGNVSAGLTSLGCPFVEHDYGDNAAGTLNAAYSGWFGPFDPDTNTAQVLLRSRVTGTLEDSVGNAYTVSGKFTDSSTHIDPFGDLMFDGVGQVKLSGPAGVVDGTAEFRAVNGPLELDLVFSSIKECTISSS
jgi:hypothetical protein